MDEHRELYRAPLGALRIVAAVLVVALAVLLSLPPYLQIIAGPSAGAIAIILAVRCFNRRETKRPPDAP